MKQESVKKTPKWLLPVIIAAALLVVVGIVLAIFLPKLGQGGESDAIQSKLYWNVDRLANVEEESGMSIREPGADGLYAIRFAVGGEQVEYKATDKRLVNAIDLMDVMGLVFDEDGLIVDALDPKAVATEVGREVFTKTFNGSMLIANSSQAMNGMPIQAEITEKTGIWDVSPDAEVVGQKGEPRLLDMVSIYADADGVVTDIFIVKRAKEAGVYYRVGTYYDSNLASTTREPDANGVYTMLFAHEGEQVELKCKDKDLVSNLDAGTDAKLQMGLVFDEEGYIVERVSVAEAVKGKLLYTMYDVTAVSGNMITAESKWSTAKDKGEVVDFEIPEECDDIFLMENKCGGKFVGQRVDSLQVGDRVYVYSDFENNPVLIFITHRGQDYPLYYNISRKYDSEKQETTRTPENGWYVFEMAKAGGSEVTLKTKDKDLASRVDSFSYMGLKVENGIILNVCDPVCVSGRSGLGNRYVMELMGTIGRYATASDLTTGSNLMMAPDCKFYDMTGAYGVPLMSETTVRLKDRVSIYRTPGNEVAFGFVLDRYEEGTKIYYNTSRQYSSKQKSTTREPDKDGYYVFDMTCEGKEVQLKTKDKKLATYIDKQSSRFLALRVSGSIIKAAYKNYHDSIEYGNKLMSGVYFDYIDADRKVHYYTMSNGKKTEGVSSYALADNYVVYNNSTAYIKNQGEKTTLQKGDYIYAVTDRSIQKILQIFVRTREIDAPLYWKVDRKYNDTTKETTREPNAEGYYVFDLVVNGEIKTFKTKDKDVASRVDYYSYAFTMITKGDIIIAPTDATNAKGVEKHLYRFTYVKEIKGNTVITYTTTTTSENYGKDLELKFTKNSKISDVCTYSDGFGKATTLVPGDRVVSYVDKDEKVLYCFVDRKCTRKAGSTGICEHCGEEVTWTPFVGTIDKQDMHYYLPNDRSRTQRTIGYTAAELAADDSRKQYKTCFDLNGHTLTSSDRNFFIYSELNLMDSAGGGKLISADKSTALRTSFSSDAKVNIYGGTYQKAEGFGTVGSGALIYGGGCTINIYDGTFVGGKATMGGIANIGSGSTLNIEGGTFISGTADQGNSIYILGSNSAPSILAMKGCKIDGGVDPDGNVKIILGSGLEIGNAKNAGLKLQSGKLVDVSKLDDTSSVYVNALGVFTTERDDIETVKNVFKGMDDYSKVQVEGKALAMNIVVAADPEPDTQKRVDKWVEKVKADDAFEAGGLLPRSCPICNGEAVIWEVAAPGMTVAKTGGHYYFNSENGNVNYEGFNLLTTSSSAVKACVYLNDQNITMQGRIRARGEMNFFGNGAITKLDTDKVASDGTKYALYGMFELARTNTTVNFYGGNYVSQVRLQDSGNNPNGTPLFRVGYADTAVNVYSGNFVMDDGAVGAVFHGLQSCEFNLYGGSVKGGTGYINGDESYGGAFYMPTGSLNILGGAVTGGQGMNGKNIYANGAAVTLRDAAVDGVELAGQSSLTLSGNVQLPDLKLAEGVIADITELNAASAITVEASGIFTTERDDIDTIKACFTPVEANKLNVVGKKLAYGEVAPPAPPAPTEPGAAEKAAVDAWVAQVKADGAFAEGGILPTTCPFCDGAVTWEAKGNGGFTAAQEGGHYYFSTATGTLTYNHQNLVATSYNGIKTCIYLNDHTININGRIRLRAGEMNIFGDGSITKLDNDGSNKALPLMNVTTDSSHTATLNIYGGTYTAAVTAANVEAGVPVIGVTAVGQGTAVNIYGGTFTVAQGAAGKVIDSTLDNTTTIYNGTFNGDINLAAGTLSVYNGTINGEVSVAENTVLNLAGKPVISGLTLNGTAVANIDGLKPEARITVNAANGKVLSNASDNAEAVKDCFLVPQGLQVAVVEKKLVVKEPSPSQFVQDWVAANGAAFRAEGKLEAGATVDAPCPFCSPNANVTWTGISSNATLADGCHVYWVADWQKASTHNAIVGASSAAKHCVYMNGFNAGGQKPDGSYYTAGNRMRLRGNLNLIAYGSTVIRPADSTASLTDIGSVLQAEGVAKVYGGTYINLDNRVPLLKITQDTTNVEIYDAALQGTGNNVIFNTAGKAGTLSLYNCTVVSNDPTVKAIVLTGGTLNIHGGTVTGGMELADTVTLNQTGTAATQLGAQSQDASSQSVKN